MSHKTDTKIKNVYRKNEDGEFERDISVDRIYNLNRTNFRFEVKFDYLCEDVQLQLIQLPLNNHFYLSSQSILQFHVKIQSQLY